MRDNVILFLLAGSETTAWSMTWFISKLLTYPDVYRNVRADIDQTLHGGELAPEHVDSAEYFLRVRFTLEDITSHFSGPLRVDAPVSSSHFCSATPSPPGH